jgi:hypothetical protein
MHVVGTPSLQSLQRRMIQKRKRLGLTATTYVKTGWQISHGMPPCSVRLFHCSSATPFPFRANVRAYKWILLVWVYWHRFFFYNFVSFPHFSWDIARLNLKLTTKSFIIIIIILSAWFGFGSGRQTDGGKGDATGGRARVRGVERSSFGPT